MEQINTNNNTSIGKLEPNANEVRSKEIPTNTSKERLQSLQCNIVSLSGGNGKG